MNNQKGATSMPSLVTNPVVTDGMVGPIELPTDSTRQNAPDTAHEAALAEVRLALDENLDFALREAARGRSRSGETMFAAAWTMVLSRLGGADDFLIRLQIGTADGIGQTTLRADLRPEAGAEAGEAPRLDVVLARIEAALQTARNEQPATDPGATTMRTGLSIGRLEPAASASFDLLLSVGTNAGGTSLSLHYRASLFSRTTAERWAGYVLAVLTAMPRHAGSRIDALPMIGKEEQLLIEGFNATAEDLGVPACVHQLVEAQAARTPEAVAVVLGAQTIRYAELDARANLLAGALRARGVGPDVPVALYVERSIDMVIGLLAVLKAGGAYVPLDPSHPPERTATILAGALPRVILTQSGLRAALPATPATPDVETLLLDGSADGDAAFFTGKTGNAMRLEALTPDNLAYVIYTSGSTGTPKGVAMHHGALVNLLRWQAMHPAVPKPQRTLQFAALGFDVAFQEIFSTLSVGGTLVLIDESVRRDPQALAGVMRSQQVERLFLPFIALQNLADYVVAAGESLPALQDVVTAGEQLHASPSVRAFFERMAGCRLHNQYGPTESHVVTALQLGADPREWAALPSIGQPITNSRIHILDRQGRTAPLGVTGEIHIGGAGVARGGYLHRPELTAERFVEDPFSTDPATRLYKTGDVGRWTANGEIEYLGRNDHQVKVRGFRVELGEVESALLAHPSVREGAVLARHDGGGDARLVAYLTAQPGAATGAELSHQLREHLKSTLASYMVPSVFVVLDVLPLSPNGKVDRRALPEPLAERPEMAEPFEEGRTDTERSVCAAFARALGIDRAGRADNFFDLGGDSLRVLKVLADLQASSARRLSTNLFFQDPTPQAIARELDGVVHEPVLANRARSADAAAQEPIALIGMAGRFPGAADVEAFWANLYEGRDTIRFFDDAMLDASVGAALRADPDYVRARGVIDDADQFDAAFFGINPNEATLMDPQQRVFLEICWECMERAGYAPDRQKAPVGVYAGMHNATYFQKHVTPRQDLVDAVGEFTVMLGNEKDYVATRVANKLNLTGPAISMNTACSTSLVAMAQAFGALRSGQCDMALAGGVAITCPPNSGYLHQEGAMLSPDGRTRSFDAQAQGTVFSDGAGVVLLKRLSDAQADGDTIYAVLRGVGVNNDGGVKASFTAPSVDGQAAVVSMALASAGVDARSISYVEAHGTATPMGDPVEVAALSRSYARHTADSGFCAIGSVKSNVGHMLMAAGAAGVIKTALALHEETLPASLHFDAENPAIDFAGTPFRVNAQRLAWPRQAGAPRRAGVSSFGVGGTNAHLILEEAPLAVPSEPVAGPQLLTLSARTPTALARMAAQLADHLEATPAINLGDVAHTLRVGRKLFSQRLAVVADGVPEAISALRDLNSPRRIAGVPGARVHEPVLLFPGQGAQYAGMGRTLYVHDEIFRAAIDEVAAALEKCALPFDLRERLFSNDPDALAPTAVTQPATFALEYALAKRALAFGLRPVAMIGHSVGEFAAAVIANVMSLADAARLVAQRGALMQALPAGQMLSVRLGAVKLAPYLVEGVSLAADNGPATCVVAGPSEKIVALQSKLEADGIASRLLPTSHAFHSSMMDAAVAPFEALVRTVELRAPQRTVVSTLTGRVLSATEATDPAYWARHLREPVLFSPAVRTAMAQFAQPLFIELGPRNTLSTLVRQHAVSGSPAPAAVSVFAADPAEELIAFDMALGRLWAIGVDTDLGQLDMRTRKARVRLPTYPFERKRHWVDIVPATPAAVSLHNVSPATPVTITEPHMSTMSATSAVSSTRRTALHAKVRELFEDISGTPMADADGAVSFIDQGLDSLVLTQAALQVKKHFKTNITFRQLMEGCRSFDLLVDHLDGLLPPEPAAVAVAAVAPMAPAPLATATAAAFTPVVPMAPLAVRADAPMLQQLIQQQMQLMQQQLALLAGNAPAVAAAAVATEPAPLLVAPTVEREAGHVTYDVKKAFGAIARIHTTPNRDITGRQQARLDAFIRRYVERTQKSKSFTAANRGHMADPRVVNGFRPATKEITYQIVVERSKASRVWDVDGNEYVDVLNGFGMNMFGWQPDFINDAVKRQLDIGYEIGPQHPLAAEVTARICELTGFDRAALCNTGSEAVMAAVRIARTHTGRSTVVLFSGSYHGTFDEVLVRAGRGARGIPATPGVMSGMFGDVRVLDYGTPESLEFIRENADDLAAVLIEPVQSRRPDFQPKEFLQEVRNITEKSGTCMIIDEVITGFRSHPGGAQALFGVRGDLATYGKVIGGGMPIGAIAGKREFMDALDGGAWNYGDDSIPSVGVTYFAGTFVRHPLALAAAKASLDHLANSGVALQTQLNLHTAAMADELTAFCREVGAPLEIRYFASLWRVSWLEDHPLQDLLFAMMRSRGVHILDNFPCFMTTAHTPADIATIKQAFKESVAEMQQAEFLPGRAPVARGFDAANPPVPDARLGRDRDGQPAWFVPDPAAHGKYVKLQA
ncbi:amino acid adenylation domain-containing protein [Variovorax sp. RHLX14]|uniref:amino acid adenylation domain-containing protein n=1 Tax=Variovorax sp. RHLX14 TaxID=1259731 RepID=UPI003F466AD1